MTKGNKVWVVITLIALVMFFVLVWKYIELQRQISVADCLNRVIDMTNNRPDHIGVCNYLQTGKSEWLGTWAPPKP